MIPLVEINILVLHILEAESEIQAMRAWKSAQPSWEDISISNLNAMA
jgi:hypothetical protein